MEGWGRRNEARAPNLPSSPSHAETGSYVDFEARENFFWKKKLFRKHSCPLRVFPMCVRRSAVLHSSLTKETAVIHAAGAEEEKVSEDGYSA